MAAMIRKVLKQVFSKELPRGYRILNLCILTPVLLYPFVFFTTIFFFDNPRDLLLTYLLFFAVNAYPVYLLLVAYFNSILLRKNKLLGSLLPMSIIMALIFGAAYIVREANQNISEINERETERRKEGYIGANDDLKIIEDNVYYYDTLIIEADAKTFEIVSGNWQRDKNYYYYLGKRVDDIDRNSFEDLGYHYGKDKLHVYYNDKIIKGADSKTFIHIGGTQDGKDKNNCYRWGKKVNCDVLLIEE